MSSIVGTIRTSAISQLTLIPSSRNTSGLQINELVNDTLGQSLLPR